MDILKYIWAWIIFCLAVGIGITWFIIWVIIKLMAHFGVL